MVKSSDLEKRENNKSLESRLTELIELMVKGEIKELIPEFDLTSDFGYSIKVARDILKAKPGEEFVYLDDLTDRGFLIKEHFDTVNLCPHCVSFTLKINTECPLCSSLNIKKTELIHHFGCGYIDLSEKFEKNGDLVCPKCLKHLRHIGVDYERPGETYKCESCDQRFTRPKDFYYCLKCHHKFRMEEVASKRVNKYRLSPEAKALLERGAITSKTRLVAFDPLTKVYRDYVFQSVFLREAKRASRYKTNTSVVKVEVENWSSCRQRLGVEGCSLILRRLAEIIKGNLREVDFISRVGDSFIILLPNTGETGVKRVVQKLSTVISAFLEAGDLKVKPEVDIKSITYHPNDIKDIEYPKI